MRESKRIRKLIASATQGTDPHGPVIIGSRFLVTGVPGVFRIHYKPHIKADMYFLLPDTAAPARNGAIWHPKGGWYTINSLLRLS